MVILDFTLYSMACFIVTAFLQKHVVQKPVTSASASDCE